MFGVPTIRPFLITVALCLAALSSVQAQTMVSVKGSTVNMRTKPTTSSEILWELKRGYPLKVVQRKGRWLQIRDFEGDKGWVARSLMGSAPHFVVKSRIANMRKGPGTNHPIVGKAAYGDLLKTSAKRNGWAHVVRSDGKKGWISQKLLWGW
jgi:SH3-like domain-containing protein